MNNLKIEFLADHPQAFPILKTLFETEWEPYYGKNGPGNAEQDIASSANKTQLPIALVAICDGNICGTAALKMESVTTYPDIFPWLAALLVDPAYRCQGVAAQLILKIEALAKQLGFSEIFVGAGEKSGLSEATLNKRAWKLLHKSDYFVSEVRIYKKVL